MDVRLGPNPLTGEPIGRTQPISLGTAMSLVVFAQSPGNRNGLDIAVRNCEARDSDSERVVLLTDEFGCVLQKKLISPFRIKRNAHSSTADSSQVMAYANLESFKFPDSTRIRLICKVATCRRHCNIACPLDDERPRSSHHRVARHLSLVEPSTRAPKSSTSATRAAAASSTPTTMSGGEQVMLGSDESSKREVSVGMEMIVLGDDEIEYMIDARDSTTPPPTTDSQRAIYTLLANSTTPRSVHNAAFGQASQPSWRRPFSVGKNLHFIEDVVCIARSSFWMSLALALLMLLLVGGVCLLLTIRACCGRRATDDSSSAATRGVSLYDTAFDLRKSEALSHSSWRSMSIFPRPSIATRSRTVGGARLRREVARADSVNYIHRSNMYAVMPPHSERTTSHVLTSTLDDVDDVDDDRHTSATHTAACVLATTPSPTTSDHYAISSSFSKSSPTTLTSSSGSAAAAVPATATDEEKCRSLRSCKSSTLRDVTSRRF